jgi:hypothetical protein
MRSGGYARETKNVAPRLVTPAAYGRLTPDSRCARRSAICSLLRMWSNPGGMEEMGELYPRSQDGVLGMATVWGKFHFEAGAGVPRRHSTQWNCPGSLRPQDLILGTRGKDPRHRRRGALQGRANGRSRPKTNFFWAPSPRSFSRVKRRVIHRGWGVTTPTSLFPSVSGSGILRHAKRESTVPNRKAQTET